MSRSKSRPILLVSVVLATVVITATMTRSLVRAQAAGQQQVTGLGGFDTLITRQQGVPAPQQAMPIPRTLVRSAKMTGMDVSADGRLVTISGGAEIYDTVPGSNYVWLLRVYTNEPQKRLLTEHHYIDHSTTIPEGNAFMSPHFLDVIALDPGQYKVELSVYAVPPGFPFDRLGFGEDMKKHALARVSHIKKVVVGG